MPDSSAPGLLMLCEGLQVPPRAGFHHHLLGLADAFAPLVSTRVLAWGTSLRPGDGESSPVELMQRDRSSLPAWRRKALYLHRACQLMDSQLAPDSIVWVRDVSTAMWMLPRLHRWKRQRRKLRFLYDASSLMELEEGWREAGLPARMRASIDVAIRRNFDQVRTLGPAMRDHLVESGVAADRVVVVPVGANAPQRRQQRSGALRRLLYTGSAQPWQGLPVLIEAMRRLEARLPELRLTVAGCGPDDVRGSAELRNVHFVGWVDSATMKSLYMEHDALLLPRPRAPLTETVVPMKVAEALVHGVPLIATDLRAVREVAGAESTCYFAESEPDAIAAAIESLAEDEARLEGMRQAAGEVGTRLSWDAIVPAAVRQLFGDS